MLNQPFEKTYSDRDFLALVVELMEFLTKTIPKQMIVIKNIHSEQIFCSDYMLQLSGTTASEIMGKKTSLALYDNDPDFENIILEEDQMVFTSREPKTLLKINKFTTGLTPYLCTKSPIINPSSNRVIGLLFQGFEIGPTSLEHYIKKLFPLSKRKKVDSSLLPKLSKREKQVVFFFLANMSSQEISEILYKIEGKRISKSTIDSLFNDQLYAKFNVHNRLSLYKKLLEIGYENKIPRELLASTSVVLDMFNIY
jgi:hypothetical protein